MGNCNNICTHHCQTTISKCRICNLTQQDNFSRNPALPMQHDLEYPSVKNSSSQTPLFKQEISLENLGFSSFFYRREELAQIERFPEIKNEKVLKTLKKLDFYDFSQINSFFKEFQFISLNEKQYFSNKKINVSDEKLFQKEYQLAIELFLNEIQTLSVWGPCIMEDNSIYEGQWKCGKRHGYGKMLFSDGSLYEGYFKDDKAYAQGKLVHSSGDCFIGQWKDNKAEGIGIYFHNDGSIYHGEWLSDRKNGFGIEKWMDGSEYIGMYSNGEKNGKGVFKWADGSFYEGDFVENYMHGKGNYCWNDGRKYRGYWIENKIWGYGKYEYPDGRFYIGNFVDNKVIFYLICLERRIWEIFLGKYTV